MVVSLVTPGSNRSRYGAKCNALLLRLWVNCVVLCSTVGLSWFSGGIVLIHMCLARFRGRVLTRIVSVTCGAHLMGSSGMCLVSAVTKLVSGHLLSKRCTCARLGCVRLRNNLSIVTISVRLRINGIVVTVALSG